MDGITDTATRRIHRAAGADMTMTEFISAAALHYSPKKVDFQSEYHDDEHPVWIQFFGKEPEFYGEAARYAKVRGFDGFDINFGCPSKKVVRNGCGVALMAFPDLCKAIITEAVDGSDLPVSIKIRSGFQGKGSLDWLERLRLDELGVQGITVHGRTFEQLFSGGLDVECVRQVVAMYPSIPVVANGGIDSVARASEVLAETGAAGVMIGQASYGNPWLFESLRRWRKTGDIVEPNPAPLDRVATLEQHLVWSIDHKGEKFGIIETRKHMNWYLKGLPHVKPFRMRLMKADGLDAVRVILDDLRVHLAELPMEADPGEAA
jgi:tRNA-dihydrouridine synthase B